jgi:hypothetical protein
MLAQRTWSSRAAADALYDSATIPDDAWGALAARFEDDQAAGARDRGRLVSLDLVRHQHGARGARALGCALPVSASILGAGLDNFN